MKISSENKKRRDKLFSQYDPILGIGSPLERFKVVISKSYALSLPVSMRDHPFINALKSQNLKKENINKAIRVLESIRIQHDFEFWAFRFVKIQDKITKSLIPFKLNSPQRKILARIEAQRLSNTPIRIDLLKARQYGGSTLVQIYFAWVQCVLKTNWHSVIVADVEDQTKNIRSMYKRFAEHYKPMKLSLRPYEGSTKNKILPERGCVMYIGSMQKPDSLRSTDNAMIHASEVGLWKKTDGKSPEDLLQNLIASVPDTPLSIIVRESTAKGVGNYWHRCYTASDGFEKVFVGWHEVEIYQKALTVSEEDFFASLNDYEQYLWSVGATLEGIYWYRTMLKYYNDDTWRMCSEFPTTAVEAFQSTGRRFYPPQIIADARKYICKPILTGDIWGAETFGEKSLVNLRFQKNAAGELQIWSLPDTQQYTKRYIVSVDIGGRSSKADWSTINVIDRLSLADGGALERAALWRGHIDQDLLAYKAAQIAKFYQNALLVVEVNSLDREEVEGTEGINYRTVLDELIKFYQNIYARNDEDKLRTGVPLRYGFHMNKSTKPLVMNAKLRALREGEYIEYSEEAINEADVMEIRNNGVISAVVGCHDDIEVPTATAIYVSSSLAMPEEVKDYKAKQKHLRNISEASF